MDEKQGCITIEPQTETPVALRRADWRFLLPQPPGGTFAHVVLLGGPAGLAERLVEVGIAHQVSVTLPSERCADAVVMLHDTLISPDAAVACLLPGGAFYYEVDRAASGLLATTPGRVRGALRRLGVIPTATYWVTPDFHTPKRYIPLDVPGALKWYLKTFYMAATPWHHLMEMGVRTLAGQQSSRLAPLVPCYAVVGYGAATLGLQDEGYRPLIGNQTATQLFVEGLSAEGQRRRRVPSVLAYPALPCAMESHPRPLMLTSGQDDGSRVILLPFREGSSAPDVVLKVSRLPEFNTNTEREQATLAEVRARLDGALDDTLPKPLGTFAYGELTVGIESVAPGCSLAVSSGQWRVSPTQQVEDLRLATHWLGEFHRQMQVSQSTWSANEVRRWVHAPLLAYAQTFGLTNAETRLFTLVRRAAQRLTGTPLPIVWQHNDFGPWNLYRHGHRLTVIDWEFGGEQEAERVGPALCDLIYFVTHWSYLVRHCYGDIAEVRGFYNLWIAPHQHGAELQAAHTALADYMARLGMDPRSLPVLLVTTWVARALDRLKRQQTLMHGGAQARHGNRYVQYLAVLADDAEQLFGEEEGVRAHAA